MTKLQAYWKTLTSDKKQELADKVDKKKGTLTNLFNGEKNPSLDLIRSLIDADNKIKFQWFLEGKKSNENKNNQD